LHAQARKLEDPAARFAILATVDSDGFPATRALTLRAFSSGQFVFSVNPASPKAKHLQSNGLFEVLFIWPKALVQIRVRGTATMTRDHAVVAEWPRRPVPGKTLDLLHARGMAQSQSVESREALLATYDQIMNSIELDTEAPDSVVALCVDPRFYEIWIGSPQDRVHDRRRFVLAEGGWSSELLVP
jgi:pyridoxine/pyridoxamine 5'-phosphate oxidase